MLPEVLRLDANEIPSIAKRGKKIENSYFFIRAWFDDSLKNSQFAIAVSVKIDKRAVVRNRIKRKLRASIIQMLNENSGFRKGKYLIVVTNKELKDLNNEEIINLLSMF